jgi:hypothetical protein
MFLFHPSSAQKISKNIFRIFFSVRNLKNIFRNILHARRVIKKRGWKEKLSNYTTPVVKKEFVDALCCCCCRLKEGIQFSDEEDE